MKQPRRYGADLPDNRAIRARVAPRTRDK